MPRERVHQKDLGEQQLHKACVSTRKGMPSFYDRGGKDRISKGGERAGACVKVS